MAALLSRLLLERRAVVLLKLVESMSARMLRTGLRLVPVSSAPEAMSNRPLCCLLGEKEPFFVPFKRGVDSEKTTMTMARSCFFGCSAPPMSMGAITLTADSAAAVVWRSCCFSLRRSGFATALQLALRVPFLQLPPSSTAASMMLG